MHCVIIRWTVLLLAILQDRLKSHCASLCRLMLPLEGEVKMWILEPNFKTTVNTHTSILWKQTLNSERLEQFTMRKHLLKVRSFEGTKEILMGFIW